MSIRERSKTLWTTVGAGAVVMIAPAAIGRFESVGALITFLGLGIFFGAFALIRMLRCPTCGSPAWAKSLALALTRRDQRVECQHCSAALK